MSPTRAWPLPSLAGLLLASAPLGCSSLLRTPSTNAPASSALATRCSIGASQTSVIVTEWAASERANMEASLHAGAVAVAFSGCTMQVLPQCRLGGSYVWQRTSPSTDVIRIQDESDLFTKLPLGAVALEAELQRAGLLQVVTMVSGQHRLQGFTAPEVPHTEACAQATHVLGALSVGAFSMFSGQRTQGGAAISIQNVGSLGGGNTSDLQLLRSAGTTSACALATNEQADGNCAAPLQAFLEPIPGRAEKAGPPGTTKVEIVSDDPDVRWDVYVDDEATCSTPCSRWVAPERPLTLKGRAQGTEVTLDRLSTSPGPQRVVAHNTNFPLFVTGLTFTSLGGMAVVTGSALMGVGCGRDNGLCTPGIITAGVGAPVVAASIWMMLEARAKADVEPVFAPTPELQLRVAPGALYGTF